MFRVKGFRVKGDGLGFRNTGGAEHGRVGPWGARVKGLILDSEFRVVSNRGEYSLLEWA